MALGTKPFDDSSGKPSSSSSQDLCDILKRRKEQVYYYREKLRVLESKMDIVSEECEQRIRMVRHFWREKIYLEGSRPGKILKISMQK